MHVHKCHEMTGGDFKQKRIMGHMGHEDGRRGFCRVEGVQRGGVKGTDSSGEGATLHNDRCMMKRPGINPLFLR